MPNAKVTFKVEDRSTNVVSLSGISVGMAIISDKGEPFKAKRVTNEKQLLDFAGDARPTLGSTLYAAQRYLTQGNSLWVSRAVSQDAKCSAVLVRSKVDPVPQEPATSVDVDTIVVKGLDGISYDDLPSYQFPIYLGNRIYTDPKVLATGDGNTATVPVDSVAGLSEGDRVSIVTDPVLAEINSEDTDVGENLTFATITAIVDEDVTKEIITVDSNVTASAGDEVMYLDDVTPTSYSPKVFIQEDVKDSNTLVVNDSDLVHSDDTLVIGSDEVTLVSKDLVEVPTKQIVLDAPLAFSKDDNILIISQYEVEERDAFLVHTTPGDAGNNISIGTQKSPNYENAFILIVYLNGQEVERFECTKELFIDGFGNQMFIEDVVNGKSKHIAVINNPATTDLPLPSNYAYWVQDPKDIFEEVSGAEVNEDFLEGHNEIYLTSVEDLKMGDRIKIHTGATGKLGEEYKVVSVSGNSVMIDRRSNLTYKKDDNLTIYRFASGLNDPTEGIENGVKKFVPVKMDRAYPGYKIGRSMVLGGESGTIVDAGDNFTTGGKTGGPVTVGDMITALKKLDSRGSTPLNIVDDGGIADPAFAQAAIQVAKKQKTCHAHLSSPANLEDSPNAPELIVNYRESIGIDDRYASLFSGWVKVFDEVNQVHVWEPPSIYGTCAQSYVTRERTIFTPAAGLVNGIVPGLDVRYRFDDGERDYLVDNQINPIRYDNGTIAIWGNETLQKRPSPLQLRSVNFLIISLETEVNSLVEFGLFDFNDESTHVALEGAVDALLRDKYQAKRGVYSYQVAIQEVITDTDINQRRMPLFIGLQPTLDIQSIPATIAIYSKGAEIEVRA